MKNIPSKKHFHRKIKSLLFLSFELLIPILEELRSVHEPILRFGGNLNLDKFNKRSSRDDIDRQIFKFTQVENSFTLIQKSIEFFYLYEIIKKDPNLISDKKLKLNEESDYNTIKTISFDKMGKYLDNETKTGFFYFSKINTYKRNEISHKPVILDNYSIYSFFYLIQTYKHIFNKNFDIFIIEYLIYKYGLVTLINKNCIDAKIYNILSLYEHYSKDLKKNINIKHFLYINENKSIDHHYSTTSDFILKKAIDFFYDSKVISYTGKNYVFCDQCIQSKYLTLDKYFAIDNIYIPFKTSFKFLNPITKKCKICEINKKIKKIKIS